jgi:outer membrane cobalamin receptor
VSIASKSLESIYDAPGVITVITSTEIERFGANNLLEILERVASVYSVGSYFAPNNVLSIRGDLATPYNNHVLILLNGRPTRENLFGGIDYPIYLALPLQAIENIEVIRGPGSVLYGTNAYSGVINIITKDVVEEQTQIGFDYGSFNTYSFQALNTKIKDKLKITSTMRYFGQDGWRHEATGEDGNPLNYDAFQNNLGGMVNVKYNQLNINSFVSYSSQASTGVLPIDNILGVGIRNRSINTVRAFFDVGYNFDLSKKLNISTNATYNSMRTRFSIL